MNEYDAEKRTDMEEVSPKTHGAAEDTPSSTAAEENISEADVVTESEKQRSEEKGYTFIQNGCPEGRGYTTPEGAHGFVYAPQNVPRGNGIGKRLIIATSVVGLVLLLMGCCFFGAWAAARSGRNAYNESYTPQEGNQSQDNSCATGDLVIVDGTEAVEPSKPSDPSEPGADNPSAGKDPLDNMSSLPSQDIPNGVTIPKKEAQRQDANGDGVADPSFNAQGQLITSAGDVQMTVPTIINRVAASVVEITTETLVQSHAWIGQYITSGAGSGVIISEEGFIITNHHVVDGADSITVRLTDGTKYTAMLVGSDENTDVAVLWIDPGEYELTVATLGSSYDLVTGEDIIAIGNPLGSLGGTVTEGIVSATERQITIDGNDMTLLQVSAPINPGNSGGGLFNMAGELVGVVNAKMSSEELEGLGFAIPIDTAYDIACELIAHRYVRGQVTTGLTLLDVENAQTAWYYFNSQYTGVYVYESVSDVLAYGDLILSVNGHKIASVEDVSKAIAGLSVGDGVSFEVYRQQKTVTVTLTLMEYVPDYLTQEPDSSMPAA